MSVHTRFRALGLATLAAVTALSVVSASTGDGLVAQTEAAYTDSEFAKAGVAAHWPLAFASVVAGSARSSTETVTGGIPSMTYQASYQWTQELTGSADTVETNTGWPSYSRTRNQRYRGPQLLSDSTANLLPTDSSTLALRNASAVQAFTNPGIQTDPQNFRCLIINETFGPASNDLRCSLGNNLAAATNNTASYGYSADITDVYHGRLNSGQVKTAVRCGLNSAEADVPTGRVDLGREVNVFGNTYLRYTNSASLRTIWANGIEPNPDGFSSLASGQLSPMYRIGVTTTEMHAKVMPVITNFSQAAPPYAISEVAAYVELYDNSGSDSLRLKLYFVLSRSECGVKRLADATLPSRRPVLPATLPGGNGLTPYSGTGFTVASAPAPVSRMALQDHFETTTTTSLPPTITVTSPLENATGTDTTTSAPPDPSGEETITPVGTTSTTPTTTPPATKTATTVQTTTTTSAAPATAIPSDPGTLSASADTTTVGTVEVDGDELDVVVKGDTAPDDARTALAALETWINEGARPSGDWRTFTSSDPDSDGWRWAAVNQQTGTLVYIR